MCKFKLKRTFVYFLVANVVNYNQRPVKGRNKIRKKKSKKKTTGRIANLGMEHISLCLGVIMTVVILYYNFS